MMMVLLDMAYILLTIYVVMEILEAIGDNTKKENLIDLMIGYLVVIIVYISINIIHALL